MNGLDVIFVAVVVLSTLVAASHGFFFELFSFAGVIVGYLVAVWQYGRLSPALLPYVKTTWVADLAAFLIIFFVITLLAGIVGRLMRWTVGQIGLNWFDRLLGAAFGLARGALAVVILATALATFMPQSSWLTG